MLAIGLVLYNNNQAEFERLARSIARAALRLPRDRRQVALFCKWNSPPTFDPNAAGAALADTIPLDLDGRHNNAGFGQAHNMLAQKAFSAGASCYLCLNPDGLLHPGCLAELTEFADSQPLPALIRPASFHASTQSPTTR